MTDPASAELDPLVREAIREGRMAAACALEQLRAVELPLIDAVEPGHLVARLLANAAEHQ